jgi:lysine-ketoglutarate reductase/saccharopine dehydrogenase-like protein (TIGR00300 family)
MRRRFIAEGHLIDSGILASILNMIIQEGADYEIIEFRIGKTNAKPSKLELDLICDDGACMETLTKKLVQTGCYEKRPPAALFHTAERDGCAPENFYSTTNHLTEIFVDERWIGVERQRMDAVITFDGCKAVCTKLRDIRKGDRVLCSSECVRVFPPERARSRDDFEFMSNEISSERGIRIAVESVADEMRKIKGAGGKIVAVPGPVVIHSNGSRYFARLCRDGYIGAVLSGNALAVHDIEYELFGTSLGIDLATGRSAALGHRNHMRAINAVKTAGSIRALIQSGRLSGGIMFELETMDIPYVLAGSIRDDGPLPETETDMVKAQDAYAAELRDADMVLMCASMLHSIGVGNMLPSWVKTVCVDINPPVLTKLLDRGSAQAAGIVSDVGLFLQALTEMLVEDCM